MNKGEETRLAEAAAQCDRESYEKLIKAFQRPLLGFIRSRVGPTYSEVEDIAQEVWLDVWNKIHRPRAEGGYDPNKGRFYTWVLSYSAVYILRRWLSDRSLIRERELLEAEFQLPMEEEESRALENVADTAPSPLDALMAKEEYKQQVENLYMFLSMVFLCGGYPHQQLAFGFSKLIYGTSSARGIEGKPLHVDKKHGDRELEKLRTDFLKKYADIVSLPEENIDACVSPIDHRLALSARELFKNDKASMEQAAESGLSEKRVGGTQLRDYYSKRGPSYSIPDWCHKMEKRIRTVLGVQDRAKACARCKLRHTPPCVAADRKE